MPICSNTVYAAFHKKEDGLEATLTSKPSSKSGEMEGSPVLINVVQASTVLGNNDQYSPHRGFPIRPVSGLSS